jgi:hypothetical protein
MRAVSDGCRSPGRPRQAATRLPSADALPPKDGARRRESNPHRELGKLPRTAPYRLIYSSAGTRTDRGCPWLTAGDRCLGHAGGTAGEDAVARVRRRWLQLDCTVRRDQLTTA